MAKNPEFLSVAELADSVQKSKQWIYRLVKTDSEFAKYVVNVDGKQKIKKAAIPEFFGYTEVVKPEDQLMSILTEQVNSQRQQIEALQRTIDSLHEMLKAEQLLRANADQRIMLLEDKLRSEQAGDPERSEQPEGSSDQAQDQNDQEQVDHDNRSDDQGQEQPERLTFLQRFKKIFGL